MHVTTPGQQRQERRARVDKSTLKATDWQYELRELRSLAHHLVPEPHHPHLTSTCHSHHQHSRGCRGKAAYQQRLVVSIGKFPIVVQCFVHQSGVSKMIDVFVSSLILSLSIQAILTHDITTLDGLPATAAYRPATTNQGSGNVYRDPYHLNPRSSSHETTARSAEVDFPLYPNGSTDSQGFSDHPTGCQGNKCLPHAPIPRKIGSVRNREMHFLLKKSTTGQPNLRVGKRARTQRARIRRRTVRTL